MPKQSWELTLDDLFPTNWKELLEVNREASRQSKDRVREIPILQRYLCEECFSRRPTWKVLPDQAKGASASAIACNKPKRKAKART